MAYIDDDGTAILHARNCANAIKLMSSRGDRIVSAQWVSHKVLSHLVIIEVTGIDRQGVVSEITGLISQEMQIKIRSVHFEGYDGVFSGKIYLYIYDTDDLQRLMENLRKVKGVHNVKRIERTGENE